MLWLLFHIYLHMYRRSPYYCAVDTLFAKHCKVLSHIGTHRDRCSCLSMLMLNCIHTFLCCVVCTHTCKLMLILLQASEAQKRKAKPPAQSSKKCKLSTQEICSGTQDIPQPRVSVLSQLMFLPIPRTHVIPFTSTLNTYSLHCLNCRVEMASELVLYVVQMVVSCANKCCACKDWACLRNQHTYAQLFK
jgi:hypothetical protein